VVLAVGVLASIRPARAQDALLGGGADAVTVSPSAPQTYGTASSVVLPLWASDFQLVHAATVEGAQSSQTGARTCSSGDCPFVATLHLPAGAHVTGLDVDACDGDVNEEVSFFAFVAPSPVQPIQLFAPTGGTGVSANPGCATFSIALDFDIVNSSNFYGVDVMVPTGTGLSLSGVRVHYNLRVSDPPAVATFNDVPTSHPFFQFIEALAASGITGGCGNGNYCPDNPVTRGQMAVFLSKALGLHFPN
jgi:hypothetical protein